MAKEIRIEDNGSLWKTEYENEAGNIRKRLGKNCLAVHHVGAVTFSGLESKPIVDYVVIVTHLGLVDSLRYELEALGYKNKSDKNRDDERLYVRCDESFMCTLHIFSVDNRQEIDRYMAMREFFRLNPAVAKEYEEHKLKLAHKYGCDSNEYIKGKEEFLCSIEKKALSRKREQDRLSLGMAIGTLLGFVGGIILGVSIDNITFGMSCGVAVGLIFGFAISSIDKNK